jgi:nucleoid DNA-binding protein
MVNQEEERPMIFNAPELSRDLATEAGISVSNARDHVDIVFAVIERELRNGGEVRMESKTDHD